VGVVPSYNASVGVFALYTAYTSSGRVNVVVSWTRVRDIDTSSDWFISFVCLFVVCLFVLVCPPPISDNDC